MANDNIEDGFELDLYEDDEDTLKDKYLTFRLAEEDYGIEIRYVTEIICIQKITEIPNVPEYVKGVINLRGKVVPVIDMRMRFNMPNIDYTDRTCIIVTNYQDTAVGLLIDMVKEVVNIDEKGIDTHDKISISSDNPFIQGIGKADGEVKIILDIKEVLYAKQSKKLESVEVI